MMRLIPILDRCRIVCSLGEAGLKSGSSGGFRQFWRLGCVKTFTDNLASFNSEIGLVGQGIKKKKKNRDSRKKCIHPLIHYKHTSRKKESTDIGTDERKKIQVAQLGIEAGPLVLRTSALTTELSRCSL